MKTLSVIPLGCGGGVPVFPLLGNTNFALVYHEAGVPVTLETSLRENPFWLIDCGPETISLLAELDAFKQLQGVIITHVHADHSGGLASLAYRMMFVEKRKIPLVFAVTLEHLLVPQLIELRYLNTTTSAYKGTPKSSIQTFFTTPRPFEEDEVEINSWPFRVALFPVSHNIVNFPCFGVEIKAEDGTRFVFSGDTAYPLHPDYMDKADLIFHDVQTYNPGDGYEVHCPYQKLKDAVPLERRHKVVLCHTPFEERFLADGFRHATRGSFTP